MQRRDRPITLVVSDVQNVVANTTCCWRFGSTSPTLLSSSSSLRSSTAIVDLHSCCFSSWTAAEELTADISWRWCAVKNLHTHCPSLHAKTLLEWLPTTLPSCQVLLGNITNQFWLHAIKYGVNCVFSLVSVILVAFCICGIKPFTVSASCCLHTIMVYEGIVIVRNVKLNSKHRI